MYNFFNGELNRSSVDGKGMELVSVVNCTYSAKEQPPTWSNAVWWQNRMWYGQVPDGSGKLQSLARYLDVIAHELTHGITQYSSDLIYDAQSGALNESFSDIFGVVVNNWYIAANKDDVGTWDWQIGRGWGDNGKPLRDMQDPKATGDPDHMNDYWDTVKDNGGVHTNSNIHNKAAYNVFTAKDAQGSRVFKPKDVAVLYYLCLIRLNKVTTFVKTLQALVDVAITYYEGDPSQPVRLQSIRQAYKDVGITVE